MLHLKHSLEAD